MKELIAVVVLLLLLVPIPWLGRHPFSIANVCKNGMYKLKHTTFRVPLDRAQCGRNLRAFKHAMGTVPFWLSEGTALGAIRDGDFIAHDDDVDVGIWKSDLKRFNSDVLPKLRRAGFSLDWDLFGGTFMAFSRKGERLDVDAVGPKTRCMSARVAATDYCTRCECIMPYLQAMQTVVLHGEEYSAPGVDYVEYLYGPDWRVPKRKK